MANGNDERKLMPAVQAAVRSAVPAIEYEAAICALRDAGYYGDTQLSASEVARIVLEAAAKMRK